MPKAHKRIAGVTEAAAAKMPTVRKRIAGGTEEGEA